jgi:PIN domain nuclease of toxin-antitoxin system
MISAPGKLSGTVKNILESKENEIFLSAVSGWEIAIKYQIGKLRLAENPDVYIPRKAEENSLELLPIEMNHAVNVSNLPDIHNDPFDRLLISQSQLENLPLITNDEKIKRYSINTIW